MSGGSFNYLCHKDFSDLISAETDIQQMADELARLGYAPDAAQETMEVLLEIRQARIRIEARTRRLNRVWQAIEWWQSGDYSEDAVKEAIRHYGNQLTKP